MSYSVKDVTKTTAMMYSQYDLDTNSCIPNFIPDDNIRTIEECERYEEYTKGIYSCIKSCVGYSPRGEWYKYADLFKGKIVAIGEEQGNYAGGELISIDSNSKEEVKAYINNMVFGDEYARDLYKKICNLEIADLREVQTFNKAALDYAHQLRK